MLAGSVSARACCVGNLSSSRADPTSVAAAVGRLWTVASWARMLAAQGASASTAHNSHLDLRGSGGTFTVFTPRVLLRNQYGYGSTFHRSQTFASLNNSNNVGSTSPSF